MVEMSRKSMACDPTCRPRWIVRRAARLAIPAAAGFTALLLGACGPRSESGARNDSTATHATSGAKDKEMGTPVAAAKSGPMDYTPPAPFAARRRAGPRATAFVHSRPF